MDAQLRTFTGEMKAEPMSTTQLDRWLGGKISRRILAVPFGGPIPKKGAPLGVDIDGEYFDADTDIYGEYTALRANRERLTDWHHGNDPTGRMKGAVIGRIVLDEQPEDDGYWADFWANAGEERRNLVARLERNGVPLFGSSQALYKKASRNGHIEVWPIYRHTISTSPQNTWAVVPPLKALLTADDLPIEGIGFAAIKAALLGLGDLATDLTTSLSAEAVAASLLAGDSEAKAGRTLSAKNEAALRTRIEELIQLVDSWVTALPVEVDANT